MKAKKVLDFLILRPAFSSRNLTSILLVALFFGVYVLAGGKVTMPNVKQGQNFGSISKPGAPANTADANRVAEPRAGQLVRPAQVEQVPAAKLNPPNPQAVSTPSAAAQGESADKLRSLEERLKGLKRKQGE